MDPRAEPQGPRPEIIDVHAHCFVTLARAGAIARGWEKLRRAGLRKMVVAGLVNTHLDPAVMKSIISGHVVNHGDPGYNEADDLLALARRSDHALLPFVDTTSLWGGVPELKALIDRGFRGVKGIFLPDDDNDLGVKGVAAAFGLSRKAYQRREWEFFEFAQAGDLPLLYHMDARRHGALMTAMLEDFPALRVNFAHFGIGRKAFAKILDRYPNVFTDFSSLLPYVRADYGSYRDFIRHYADRVCFGTDTLLYQLETVQAYIQMVQELALPEETVRRICAGNPERFLGAALQAPKPDASGRQ